MKKALSILLAAILLAALCACGGAEGSVSVTPTPMPTATPTASPTPEPTPTPEPYVLRERIPILMYHQIAEPEENNLYLSPENFRSQLDWLDSHGFTGISMEALYEHWVLQKPLPENPIVLSFDDGYLPMYTEAMPRIREKGWSATFYMISDAVNNPAEFMSAEQLAEMCDSGMEIGSHTVHHSDLAIIDRERAAAELADSRAAIEAMTGRPCTAFCYPSGKYDDELAAMCAECGYHTAVTTQGGVAGVDSPLYLLPRIRISSGMDGEALAGKLAGNGVQWAE